MKNLKLFSLFIVVFALGTTFLNAQNSTKIDSNIEDLLTKKRIYNKQVGFGYKIQIYYGNETRAKSLRNKFRYEFPGIYNSLRYNQPYWKVLVGNYKTKLEADRDLVRFSEKFSSLIIVPMGK